MDVWSFMMPARTAAGVCPGSTRLQLASSAFRSASTCVACVIAATSLLPLPAKAQTPPQKRSGATVSYVTQAGDSLYDIGSRYLSEPRDWKTLRRLNRVQTPRHLPAGLALRVPVALLKKNPLSARVAATNGPVQRMAHYNVFVPLTPGMTVGEGDRIHTGHDGFVTLEFDDGTHVTVPQDSTIEIGTMQRTALTGATDRVIFLQRGEVSSEVTHAKGSADRFQIRSPSAVAGVRGTGFLTRYDATKQSTAVSVIEGLVGVNGAGKPGLDAGGFAKPIDPSVQLVPAAYGNVTDSSGHSGPPIVLLPPPQLVEPGKVQDARDVVFDLAPQPEARAYRVQIARDAGMLDLLHDQQADVPHAVFGDLPDGNYFVRIASIDGNGLEGLPRVYAFERRKLGVSATARSVGDRTFAFQWLVDRTEAHTRYRFLLAGSPDLREPIVDRPDETSNHIAVANLQPGLYYWTVIVEQTEQGRLYQKSSGIRSFEVAR
jgi:hypothetical protein